MREYLKISSRSEFMKFFDYFIIRLLWYISPMLAIKYFVIRNRKILEMLREAEVYEVRRSKKTS